jgi:hypothetical protein
LAVAVLICSFARFVLSYVVTEVFTAIGRIVVGVPVVIIALVEDALAKGSAVGNRTRKIAETLDFAAGGGVAVDIVEVSQTALQDAVAESVAVGGCVGKVATYRGTLKLASVAQVFIFIPEVFQASVEDALTIGIALRIRTGKVTVAVVFASVLVEAVDIEPSVFAEDDLTALRLENMRCRQAVAGVCLVRISV